MNTKSRDKNMAKFIAILIEKGFYGFKIEWFEDHCNVDLRELDAAAFHEAKIYSDGTIAFYCFREFKFKSAIRLPKKSIWSDIIQYPVK